MAEVTQTENTENSTSGGVDAEENDTSEEIHDSFMDELNDPSKQGFTIPSSTLTLPKSSLGDIVEETDGDNHPEDGGKPQSGVSPTAERSPSVKPRSRKGNGWSNSDALPNSSSTNYSTIGHSHGLDEYDLPDQWSNSRGSPMFLSPMSSPAFSPSLGGISPEPNRKSRIQIKDHGPVAKWLAKRQKKNEEPQKKPSVKVPAPKKYAPHVQPKVNTRNNEYHKPGGDVPPVRSDKLVWNAKPVVDTHNDWYVPASEDKHNPHVIMNEKLHWDSKTKVDDWNTDYKPAAAKKHQVFSEKLHWYEQPKVDSKNIDYKPPETHTVPIVDEHLHWQSKNKVDSHNDLYKPSNGKPFSVFHETPKWKAHSKLDNTRPHYMSGGGNIKVKTDKLNWPAQAKVDSINPSYVKPNGNNDSKIAADNPSRKSPKDTNGWSSHSSDSETEWFVSTPGSEHLSERKIPHGPNKSRVLNADLHYYDTGTPANRAIVWHPRKMLFNSKDLMEDEGKITSRSYPSYTSRGDQDKLIKKVPPIKSLSTQRVSNNYNGYREVKKVDKARPVFKQRKDPLPPVGTFKHRANEEVVYPDSLHYNGYRPPRSQKIEVIDMKELSLLSKKERHTIFIN